MPGAPPGERGSPRVLARSDSAGATHAFAAACRDRGVGFFFGVHHPIQRVVDLIPEACQAPAIGIGGGLWDWAWVAEATGLVDLQGWPARSRLILREERPHPGAGFTFTDVDRMRVTALPARAARALDEDGHADNDDDVAEAEDAVDRKP